MLRALLLPVNGHNPPAVAVVEQLNAVDSADERFGIVVFVARLVRAPNMRDLTKLLGATRNFLFVKSVLRKIRFHTRNEAIYVERFRREIVTPVRLCGRD